ncbi:cell wall hydrolase [Salipaludibacillus aurantiacus]|uniref:N-acetylmuramoyl-L-alanine amidase n=1 Tax=Salipaludibacillus aurantiacus TaxID=1601833 RepID=A0A1H9W6B6_9BACI|nr:cell wall hydrolase [Salipaludibacillus aurantiacus]SES29428.1 N-acetylmuramoyl-L-alanine amidase [Salipaludibacillus aurantiacus]
MKLKKLASVLLAGIFVFTAGNAVQANYEYFDSPPFDTYKVSEGDTLSYIAKRYGVELDDLYSFNPDIKGDLIVTGESIKLVGNSDDGSADRIELSASDRDLLERLVHAEARGQDYEGKIAVAEVVFNRVDSDDFPDTVRGVIMQNRQFSPVSNGAINNNPSSKTKEAVQDAVEGTNLVDDALFFWNPDIATSRWLESMTVVRTIDDHEFLK